MNCSDRSNVSSQSRPHQGAIKETAYATLSPRWEPPPFSDKSSIMHSPTIHSEGQQMKVAACNESYVTREYSQSLDNICKDLASIDSVLDSSDCIDSQGRCVRHPHNRLRKKTLFGRWKVLMKACPDCCMEVFNTVGSSSRRETENVSAKKKSVTFALPTQFRKSLGSSVASTACSSDCSSELFDSCGSSQSPSLGESFNISDTDLSLCLTELEGDLSSSSLLDEQKPKASNVDTSTKGRLKPDTDRRSIRQNDDNSPAKKSTSHDLLGKQVEIQTQQGGTRKEKSEVSTQRKAVSDPDCGRVNDQLDIPHDQPATRVSSTTKDSACTKKVADRTAPQAVIENHLMYSCQMDYVDFDGNCGHYTGTINQEFVPHGKGVLVCSNGSRMKGMWSMGRLVMTLSAKPSVPHPSENRSSSPSCTNLTSNPVAAPLLHTVVFEELKNWNPYLSNSQVMV